MCKTSHINLEKRSGNCRALFTLLPGAFIKD